LGRWSFVVVLEITILYKIFNLIWKVVALILSCQKDLKESLVSRLLGLYELESMALTGTIRGRLQEEEITWTV